MPKIPTPLTWKRRNIAVFEPYSFTNRLYAVPVSGLVAGPFAVYSKTSPCPAWGPVFSGQAGLRSGRGERDCAGMVEGF